MLRRCVLVVVLCACWLTPGLSHARKQHEFSYRFEQIWNTALRLVKVDLRMPITDRDPEGGYVLFDYVASGKRYPGSIELIAADGARRKTVVVVQVQGMPSYVEQMILDKLAKKLVNEVGEPVEPPKPPPPEPAPPPADAGLEEAS